MADAAGAAGGAGPGARPPVDVEAVLLRCVALKEAGTALFKSTEDNASAKAITKWFELLALLTTVSREAIPGQEEGGLGALLGNGPTLSPAQAAQVQELRVSALLNTAVALFKVRCHGWAPFTLVAPRRLAPAPRLTPRRRSASGGRARRRTAPVRWRWSPTTSRRCFAEAVRGCSCATRTALWRTSPGAPRSAAAQTRSAADAPRRGHARRVETLEPGNADAARELRAVHELRRREDAAARGTFAKMFSKQ